MKSINLSAWKMSRWKHWKHGKKRVSFTSTLRVSFNMNFYQVRLPVETDPYTSYALQTNLTSFTTCRFTSKLLCPSLTGLQISCVKSQRSTWQWMKVSFPTSNLKTWVSKSAAQLWPLLKTLTEFWRTSGLAHLKKICNARYLEAQLFSPVSHFIKQQNQIHLHSRVLTGNWHSLPFANQIKSLNTVKACVMASPAILNNCSDSLVACLHWHLRNQSTATRHFIILSPMLKVASKSTYADAQLLFCSENSF